jgi:hypothetical protein
MIGSDNRSEPDPKREGEPHNAEVDGQVNRDERQPGERAHRDYRRRLREKLRGLSHEQHLAYGTWALAVGTWLLSSLTYCSVRDNEEAIDRNLRAGLAPFDMRLIAPIEAGKTPTVNCIISTQERNRGPNLTMEKLAALLPSTKSTLIGKRFPFLQTRRVTT